MKTLAERYPEKLCDCSICGHGIYSHPVKSPDPDKPGKTRVICVFCDFDLMVAENATPIDGSEVSTFQREVADMVDRNFDNPDYRQPGSESDDPDFDAIEREMWRPFDGDESEAGELFDDIPADYYD